MTAAPPFVSYAQNYEDVLLWRALQNVTSGFYIDVGAWDPDLDSVTRSFSLRGWRGVNIEPSPDYHAKLVRERPRDVNLAVAVGAKPGVAALYDMPGTGLSTLDGKVAKTHAANGIATEKRQVEVSTLAEVCRQYAPEDIHFLKIDCEGTERQVLLGADFSKFRPWIVVVEATLPNSQIQTHTKWEDILLEADYVFAWFDGLNRFYVAKERKELAQLLALPPNVFDRFVKHSRTPAAPALAKHLAATGVPVTLPIEGRIALAQRCRDCNDIPKVPDAGRVQREPDGTQVQIMHNGLKVLADGYCGPWMTRLIELCRGHHEPQEERMFHEVMRVVADDASMLELGGNWAYYSAWFLSGAPGRRAVVLEPDPANLAVGERTMQLNGLQADFISGFAGAQTAPPSRFETERSGALLLPRYSVPDILDKAGIDVLDILHCDTQGAELDVLTGSRELFLAGKVRWAFVSTHVHQISGDPLMHLRCESLLRDCGAVIEAAHNPYESYSGDGLIVARFGPAPKGWKPVEVSLARQSETLYREPVHDLAEVLPQKAGANDLEARMVKGLYETFLFRNVDEGLASSADFLRRGGEVARLVQNILASDEFQQKRERFVDRYMSGLRTLPRIGPDDAANCTSLHLTLARDCALGAQGDTLLIPNDKTILPVILRQGAWEVDQIDFLRERLDASRRYTLLDIGANVGLFTRQVLRALSNISECHCFEPDFNNIDALRFNLGDIGEHPPRIYPFGLGSVDDDAATFFLDSENCGNYSLYADAMRDRPHRLTRVAIRSTSDWMSRNITGEGPILWKSDTQGGDEVIVSQTPWNVWDRVEVAVVELWRIRKGEAPPVGFFERIADIPNRRLGGAPASVEDVEAYLKGTDWAHQDLYLWR